ANEVRAGLEGLSTIGTGIVGVSRNDVVTAVPDAASVTTYVYTITFQGALAGTDLPLLTAQAFNGADVDVSIVADGQTSTLVSSGAVLELDGSGGDLNMPAEYVGLAGSGSGRTAPP